MLAFEDARRLGQRVGRPSPIIAGRRQERRASSFRQVGMAHARHRREESPQKMDVQITQHSFLDYGTYLATADD